MADRTLQLLPERLRPLGLVYRLVRGECQVPVRNNSGLAPRADREQMAWRELLDPGEDRVGCGNVLEAEVTGQAREVQLTRHGRMLEERSQL